MGQYFFAAAMPPSSSSANDKVRTFAIDSNLDGMEKIQRFLTGNKKGNRIELCQ